MSAHHSGGAFLRKAAAAPGTWSWLKEWSGYIVTVLPYVSSALVLVPGLNVTAKFAILLVFGTFVVLVRIVHEKAGIEVTGPKQRKKRPGEVTPGDSSSPAANEVSAPSDAGTDWKRR